MADIVIAPISKSAKIRQVSWPVSVTSTSVAATPSAAASEGVA